MVQAFNERIAGVFEARDAGMPVWARPAIAVALLLAGALISRFGLVELIARGYGALTWFFMAIVVVPLLTIGVFKIRRADREGSDAGGAGPPDTRVRG